MARFDINKDVRNQYRWVLSANNGEPIAVSSESYVRKADCQHGIDIVKTQAPTAPVYDNTGEGSAGYGRGY